MEAAGDPNFVGVNDNYLLMDSNRNKGLSVKTIYRYGKKKHIVEVLDNRNPKTSVRWWYLVKLKKNKVDPLDVQNEETWDNGETKCITFTNGKKLAFPCTDPDYGNSLEVPQYEKKPLGIEFAFDVRAQIEAMLNP